MTESKIIDFIRSDFVLLFCCLITNANNTLRYATGINDGYNTIRYRDGRHPFNTFVSIRGQGQGLRFISMSAYCVLIDFICLYLYIPIGIYGMIHLQKDVAVCDDVISMRTLKHTPTHNAIYGLPYVRAIGPSQMSRCSVCEAFCGVRGFCSVWICARA